MARAKLGLRGVPPCSPLGFLQNLDLSPVSALSLHGEKGGLESGRGHDHALHPSAGSHSKTRVPNGPCELGVSRRQGLTAAGAVVSPVFRHKPFFPPQYRRLLGARLSPDFRKGGGRSPVQQALPWEAALRLWPAKAERRSARALARNDDLWHVLRSSSWPAAAHARREPWAGLWAAAAGGQSACGRLSRPAGLAGGDAASSWGSSRSQPQFVEQLQLHRRRWCPGCGRWGRS